MNNIEKVKTSVGDFEIKKPKAGVRNRAMALAETDSGKIKTTVLMMQLLPKCINSRPESFDKDVKIEHVLDDLEVEDYDLLVIALGKLIEEHDVPPEEKKKE
jgi:hypothetical protein